MIRTAVLLSSLVLPGLAAQVPEPPAGASEPKDVKELVKLMRDRQETVDAVSMDMETRGHYPTGLKFTITGTIRVLGGTHFYIANRTAVDDVVTESELVRRPDGVWRREEDPAFGEVFYRIKPALVADLEAASKLIGRGEQLPGGVSKAKDPLGSAVVESLNSHFALALERRTIKGEAYYALKGDVREPTEDSLSDMPAPDHVELLVRVRDLAVLQMVQFHAGKELMRVDISRLELNPNPELAAESFVIELPEGARFIDVMDHPPAAMHINQLLSERDAIEEENRAEAAREKEKEKEKEKENAKGKGGAGK